MHLTIDCYASSMNRLHDYYLLLVPFCSLCFCQFTDLGWSHFERNTLVALSWIPSLSYPCPTELLMASTTCALFGALPVSLFCYPNYCRCYLELEGKKSKFACIPFVLAHYFCIGHQYFCIRSQYFCIHFNTFVVINTEVLTPPPLW
jgi:hypothetical protein